MSLRLLAVLAHPDDESLGCGGTLAKYASEGVETYLLTATRGERGRYHGHREGSKEHPGAAAMAALRERELRAAAVVLGLKEVSLLEYRDKELDAANPREAIAQIAAHLRRVRPHVVITFGPEGAYGHADHIAISQFTTAATVVAADPSFAAGVEPLAPHAVSKLYYIAWPEAAWAVYQNAFGAAASVVDGVERRVVPWPDWALTTKLDTRRWWPDVWRAISCHASQVSARERLRDLPPDRHEILWGTQAFYRVFSLVNGGRAVETDLFEGLRGQG